MSSGQTLARRNLTCMARAILYSRVETSVDIENTEHFCRNQVIYSLSMRHRWPWIKIMLIGACVRVISIESPANRPFCSLLVLPPFSSRWQFDMWSWYLYKRWSHSRTQRLRLPLTVQTYTMQLPEETAFSEPVSQSISSMKRVHAFLYAWTSLVHYVGSSLYYRFYYRCLART
jgi:hypothetical protein